MAIRLRAQISILVIGILLLDAMVLIDVAPSVTLHPVSHFLFIVLALANFAAIGWFEYMVNFDWRRKM